VSLTATFHAVRGYSLEQPNRSNESINGKLKIMLLRIVLMLIAFAFGGNTQTIAEGLNPNSATYAQVKALDERIFRAYNTCDLATLVDMVDETIEFYHDKTGLSLGKDRFITAIKRNICHKVRRELGPGAL
jgi:hypothetical protein